MRFRRRINRITAVLACLAVTALPGAATACGHAGSAAIEHGSAAQHVVQAPPHCGDSSTSNTVDQPCVHCVVACAATGLTVAGDAGVLPGAGSDWIAAPLNRLSGAVPAPPQRPPRGA